MAVDAKSADLISQGARYRKIRALMDSAEDARDLIEQLPGHDSKTHRLFKARAPYLPALPRTVEMFGGLLFFEPPQVEAPDSMADYLADATLDGMSFERLCGEVADEVIQISRVAVLVDHPPLPQAADGRALTRADAESLGLRASAKLYRSEDILGHSHTRIGGARVLSRVRLAETRTFDAPTAEDEFAQKTERLVRVLELFDGHYQQRVFVYDGAKKKWVQEGPPIIPIRAGKPLTYIPLFAFNHRNHDIEAQRPPLSDLADVSVDHLNLSAVYGWGLMWTGNPTPVFKGLQIAVDAKGRPAKGAEIKLGSSEGILLPAGDTDAFFLEFEGKGLEEVRVARENLRRDMGNIGARMLIDDPRVAIAADTVRIQRSGENSMLGDIAGVVSEGMTAVLQELALWAGADESGVLVNVNRDFLPERLTPEELKALIAAAQSGSISSQDLFTKLQKGGVIRRGVTFDEHKEEVERDDSLLIAPNSRSEDDKGDIRKAV